jgi:chromosomal replication initiation ATPase DnaA
MKNILTQSNYWSYHSKYTFDNFIAEESNIEAKQIALDFAKNKTKFKTLVISSSLGNGATHLACAIMNEVKLKQKKNNIFFVSFESLVCHIKDFGELPKEFLNEHYLITIDSYYNWNNQLSNYLISRLKDVKSKMIITCSEFTDVPVENVRINLSLPNISDRFLIIENLLNREKFDLSKDVIDYITKSKGFNSIRALEGFFIMLCVRAKLEGQTINLSYTKKIMKILEKNDREKNP